jgi:hypothetical protein
MNRLSFTEFSPAPFTYHGNFLTFFAFVCIYQTQHRSLNSSIPNHWCSSPKLDVDFIKAHAESLYLSWRNTRFFLRRHAGESFTTFAPTYDQEIDLGQRQEM